MARSDRQSPWRSVCLLAALGAAAAASPGCGGGNGGAKDESAAAVPPTVQESNKTMENFMKSQGSPRKK